MLQNQPPSSQFTFTDTNNVLRSSTRLGRNSFVLQNQLTVGHTVYFSIYSPAQRWKAFSCQFCRKNGLKFESTTKMTHSRFAGGHDCYLSRVSGTLVRVMS